MAQLKDTVILGDLSATGTIYGNLIGNASTATKIGTASIYLYAENNDEINIGGSNTGASIYIGHRAKDNRPKPTNYYFGGTTADATVRAATFVGALSGNATTSSYPAGFTNRSTNQTWGNQTGTTVTGWNEVNGGSVDWRRDNPNSGKISLKVDGRFYGQEGTYPTMLMRNENGYWGLCDPDAANNVWIRTTSQGIIPYQSGGSTSGNSYLGTSSWYFYQAYIQTIYSNQTFGAVWNDYAEYRQAETLEPGRCIKETPIGIMKLTSKRMEKGCEIISDTFGFAIGKTDECQTPIAAVGRVLAYTDKPRETFELGMPVCSGPNGTVSQMTEEEARQYPWCIIGTVSEIPTYEEWGTGKVKVNNRIWIRVR